MPWFAKKISARVAGSTNYETDAIGGGANNQGYLRRIGTDIAEQGDEVRSGLRPPLDGQTAARFVRRLSLALGVKEAVAGFENGWSISTSAGLRYEKWEIAQRIPIR